MILCSDGHDEICYEPKAWGGCPLCAKIKDAAEIERDLDVKVDALQSRIDILEAENSALQTQVEVLNSQVP